jgi:bifunctional UDP-N-acetylglucosamine pyrophosphorylase/glucosamine-1-phosphate N-acetyltransferase
MGTGDALRTAIKQVRGSDTVLVVGGDDSAFYKLSTLEDFIKAHQNYGAVISFISTYQDNSKTFGRVIRDDNGQFKTIIEDKDYRESGLFSEEVNCGAYLFDAEFVKSHMDRLTLSSKGEYYINNFLDMANSEGKKVNIYQLREAEEWVGVNTPEELEKANQLYKKYQKS